MNNKQSRVRELLEEDHWNIADGKTEDGPFVIRYRAPVLAPSETGGYPQRLAILWSYAEEGTGAVPSPEDRAALDVFEERLCSALEHDGHAILTAVLTFDGARQWVFYTSDFQECGERIAAMPQNDEPYPIEMEADDDPDWNYLRNEVLKEVQPNA